jgi:hypothetical protein
MPIFFFDIERRGACIRDDTGTELAGSEEVPDQAVATLVDVVRAGTRLDGGPARHARYAVVVRDEGGAGIYRADATMQAIG